MSSDTPKETPIKDLAIFNNLLVEFTDAGLAMADKDTTHAPAHRSEKEYWVSHSHAELRKCL